MELSEINKGLRPYQLEAIDHTLRRLGTPAEVGGACPMVVLPTGCGKTRTALALMARFRKSNPNRKILWLAHREELLTQTLENWTNLYSSLGVGGVVKGAKNEIEADIIFASLSTLARGPRLENLLAAGVPQLILVDEAHVSLAGTWKKAIVALDAAAKEAWGRFYRVGLTATPERSDKRDLSQLWAIAYHYPVWRAWEEGYLVRPTPRQELLPELNLDDAPEKDGDFEPAELARRLLASEVVEHTVACLSGLKGKHALVFCASVAQARQTSEALERAGWVARFLCGDTPRGDRERIVSGFKAGKIGAVCNVGVLTTGADFPVCDVVVVARPTRSRTLYIQMIGRGSRLHPGKKETLVIDLVGAEQEHPPIIAPVLLGEADEARDTEKRLRLTLPKAEGPKIWKTKVAREIHWIEVPGLPRPTYAVACGTSGVVALQAGIGGLWNVWRIPDSPPGQKSLHGAAERLSAGPVDREVAEALGADVARRALAIASPGAGWRKKPVTDAQRRILGHRAGEVATAGEASDAITIRTVKAWFADA